MVLPMGSGHDDKVVFKKDLCPQVASLGEHRAGVRSSELLASRRQEWARFSRSLRGVNREADTIVVGSRQQSGEISFQVKKERRGSTPHVLTIVLEMSHSRAEAVSLGALGSGSAVRAPRSEQVHGRRLAPIRLRHRRTWCIASTSYWSKNTWLREVE